MSTLTEQLAECRFARDKAEADFKRLKDENSINRSSKIQLYLSFWVAVFFMVILLCLAVFIQNPTRWQYTLFRTILSLAAAGIAALLPGDFEFRFKNVVRATGALAVFAFVFSQNPAQLAGVPEPKLTESFQFKIVALRDGKLQLSCFTLPYSDVLKYSTKEKIGKFAEDFIQNYEHKSFSPDDFVLYRKVDEVVVAKDRDLLDGGNIGLIFIDRNAMKIEEPHGLFTRANMTQC